MNVTRRDLGKLALASVAGSASLTTFDRRCASAMAQTPPKPNRSAINGVQFGLQPFCYHDLPMNRENRPTLIKRLVQNGMGMVDERAASIWVTAGRTTGAARRSAKVTRRLFKFSGCFGTISGPLWSCSNSSTEPCGRESRKCS